MTTPTAVLAALLIVAMCQGAEAQLGDFSDAASSQKPDSVPIFCCFSYTLRTILRSSITSAYMTSSRCNKPGVILVTKKQRHVCADPQARWVQNYLEHFQTLKNSPSPLPPQRAERSVPSTRCTTECLSCIHHNPEK